jgi:hypothetical protein
MMSFIGGASSRWLDQDEKKFDKIEISLEQINNNMNLIINSQTSTRMQLDYQANEIIELKKDVKEQEIEIQRLREELVTLKRR